MKTADVAKLLDCHVGHVSRYAYKIGLARPIGSGNGHTWSPGDALTFMVVRSLVGDSRAATARYAEGARKVGEALDSGYPPAYLVTRGGPEYVVVVESEHPGQTDEMVTALLLQASDAGAAVRVVRLRPMVAKLAPFLRDLVDA